MKIKNVIIYGFSFGLSIFLIERITLCMIKYFKKKEIASLQTIRELIVSCYELNLFKVMYKLNEIYHKIKRAKNKKKILLNTTPVV